MKTTLFLLLPCRKDQKKLTKLEAQIPYYQGRGNNEEVEKLKQQIEEVKRQAREAAMK
jgi:hypothetical protein